MLLKLLSALFQIALKHRKKVFAAFALLVPLSLAAASGMTISTSQSALLTQDHPVQKEYRAFVEEFGALDSLVAVVYGDSPDQLTAAAEELAAALRRESAWVRNVFFKVDLTPLKASAAYFVPDRHISRALSALESPEASAILNALDGNFSVERAMEALAKPLESGGFSGGVSASEAAGGLSALTEGLRLWREALKASAPDYPDPVSLALSSAAASEAPMSSGGYMTSRDGRMVFLFIQPKDASDESSFLTPFLAEMRRAADGVLAAHPEMKDRVHIGFTGSPAHVHTEAETVFSDVAHGVAGAVLLIIVIIFAGFRTVRKTVCLFVPLLCGMALSLGAVSLTVGRLNLISAAFFAVMFGMGMDFGIYLVRRAEEELGSGSSLEEAVETSLTKTGRGVFVGGLTTCAAFWGTSLTEFAGFAELGITAGIGIFACLASVFLLTPGLMLSLGVEPKRADTARLEAALCTVRARAALRGTALAICAAAALCLGSLGRTHFDYDALKLLPRNSESTELQRRMQDESDLSANSAVAVAENLEDARRIAEKIRKSPEVSRVESLSDLLPAGQEERQHQLRKMDALLSLKSKRYASARQRMDIKPAPVFGDGGGKNAASDEGKNAAAAAADAVVGQPASSEIPRIHKILTALNRLRDDLEDAQDKAFSGGAARLSEALDGALNAAESLLTELSALPPDEAEKKTASFESKISAALDRSASSIAALLNASPLREDDLDPDLLARFKSSRGRCAVYVFPKSLVWDVDALDRFMAAVRSEAPEVTGFAATHQVFSRMVPRGFMQSMAFAFLALVLMLFLDLRSVRAVAFALIPAALGLLLLQGILEIFGIDHNYASIAAYPVLLGYGSDYGVNVVHRWLERPHATAFTAAFTAGKGVLLSAATSAAGLCSIVFARHKGVSDFGSVLLAGIGACLLTAVVFLPVLIDLLKPSEGGGHACQEGKKT